MTRRTTHYEYYEVGDPAYDELCPICKGSGQTWTRGYQMSMAEARSVECSSCVGAGVRPKGASAAEKKRQDDKRKKRLKEERQKIDEELETL